MDITTRPAVLSCAIRQTPHGIPDHSARRMKLKRVRAIGGHDTPCWAGTLWVQDGGKESELVLMVVEPAPGEFCFATENTPDDGQRGGLSGRFPDPPDASSPVLAIGTGEPYWLSIEPAGE
jgi:hypothetical protein